MLQVSPTHRYRSTATCAARFAAMAAPVALALALTFAVCAQQDAPAPNPGPQQAAPAQSAAPTPADQTSTPAQTPASAPAQAPDAQSPAAGQNPAPAAGQPSSVRPPAVPEQGITEEEIKQILVGKELYLRGGYLDDTLTFNEHGKLAGHSAQGSYTLCGVEIDRVRLTKHKLELEGSRYGLHFLGALPYEDPTKAVDRVRITPKKKILKITIDRELVVKPKEKKEKGKSLAAAAKPAPAATAAPSSAAAPVSAPAPAAVPASTPDSASAAPSTPVPSAPAESASAAPAGAQPEEPDTDEAQKEIAAASPDERPADPNSVTATTSPAHAAQVLKDALNQIFSVGLDDKMMAAMPDFWKLYYQAAAAHTDFRPTDPTVLRQNTVDTKARLLTNFEPASNEFAQSSGVAGMALYHAVIGADGKPEQIAVARPIGFGLDESAVDAIGRAQFSPATKDGKPVPVLLDLVVQFRIYSKRTNVPGTSEETQKPATPTLPGPYSLEHPPQDNADHPQQAQQ
jgi:hypothetical protein